MLSKQLLQAESLQKQISVLHAFLNRAPMESLAEIEARAIEKMVDSDGLDYKFERNDYPLYCQSDILTYADDLREQSNKG